MSFSIHWINDCFLCLQRNRHVHSQWGLACSQQSPGGAVEPCELKLSWISKSRNTLCHKRPGSYSALGRTFFFTHQVNTNAHFKLFFYSNSNTSVLTSFFYLHLPHSGSGSSLLWVSSETIDRALNTCKSVLEGGGKPVEDKSYFQSVLQSTIGILDSVIFLTSECVCLHSICFNKCL